MKALDLIEATDQKLPRKSDDNSSYKHLQILSIDRASHTVQANINGYHITAVCREKNNPDICESVKGILLQSIMD